MLQKANYVLIFWDVMDQKIVQFFLHRSLSVLEVVQDCAKKIAICIYVGILWLQFRRDLGIDRMKDWIFQGTTERVENIFTCQLMEWRPTLPWSGIEF